jgi:hypothetical protein
MVSGGPTQIAMSPITAAGIFPISTVTLVPITGPPTCGTGPVVIGQTCISVILAAGCPMIHLYISVDIFTEDAKNNRYIIGWSIIVLGNRPAIDIIGRYGERCNARECSFSIVGIDVWVYQSGHAD